MGLRIANMHNGSTNNPSASLSFSTGATANEMGQIAGYQEALNNGSNGALQFFTRQNEILNERMRIVSNGNVGLGTTAPRSKLDIWGGTLSITGADFNGTFVAGSQGSMVYIGNNALTNSIAIHPNGNVGIGTNDTKGYRFAVNGDAIFTKIKVKQYSTWPDYVFEKDYNLPSLAEVEKYIQQNKHLPEVQSSAQVEKDGLDLGDNQTVLLKKIEELTLYLIEQNKKLEEQQKRILLLEEKINNTKN
jgi:hypothetical protein